MTPLIACAPEKDDIQQQIAELRRATLRMSDAVERLTRLEERHASTASGLERAFAALGKLGERITTLERVAPVHALTSRWVLGASWAALGAGGAVMFSRAFGVPL